MPQSAFKLDTKWLSQLEILGQSSQPHLSEDLLYRQQRHAARGIAEGIKHLAERARRDDADEEARCNKRTQDLYGRSDRLDRADTESRSTNRDTQRHVFVLDGGRGSGKSTALHTIQDTIADDAVVIEVPDSLLDKERPMEAILAEIERDLIRSREEHSSSERRNTLDAFLERLWKDVHIGWTLAHGEGQQALLNDALDFNDYVRARAKYNVKGYGRVDAWHSFVKDWLRDVRRKPLLVLVFDDTDLHPDAGRKILEDIRLYLSHARIVVILAADIRLMRRTLLRENFSKHHLYAEAVRDLAGTKGGHQVFVELAEDVSQTTIGIFRKLLTRVFPVVTETRADLERLFAGRNFNGPTLSEIFVGQFAREALDGDVFCALKQGSPATREPATKHPDPHANDAGDQAAKATDPAAVREDTIGAPTHGDADAKATDPAAVREDRKHALQWWFANSSYSALFLREVRAMVTFAYALYFGPDRNGKLPAPGDLENSFPRQSGAEALILLFRYHQGAALARHGTNDRAVLSAIVSREVLAGWRFLGDEPSSAEEAYLEGRMVDYWFDMRLAAAHLNPDLELVALWLPSFWIGPPWRASDRKQARLGIASLYPEYPLPWSCLYTFQLRHLDSWSAEIMTGSLYDYLWDEQAEIREGVLDLIDILGNPSRRKSTQAAIDTAVHTTYLRSKQFSEETKLSGHSSWSSEITYSTVFFRSLNLYSRLGKVLWEQEQDVKTLHEFFLKFLEKNSVDFYDFKWIDVLNHLALYMDDETETQGTAQDISPLHLAYFLRDLFGLAHTQEDRRRHYMSMWVSAAHLATLGNDFESVAFSLSAHDSHGGISYQIDDLQRPPPVSRMTRLADHAKRLISEKRSPRTIILHAWSLVPIVHGLAKVDDANIDLIKGDAPKAGLKRSGTQPAKSETDPSENPSVAPSAALDAWTKIRDFLKDALDRLESLKPEPNIRPMQATLNKIQGNLTIGAHIDINKRLSPEDLVDEADRRYWYFADFSDGDLFGNADLLESIQGDIKGAIEYLDEAVAVYQETYNKVQAKDCDEGKAIRAIAEALQVGPVPANEILKELKKLDPPPAPSSKA